MSMGCYQRCTIMGTSPAQCQQQCCTSSSCTPWTSCVAGNCSTQCF
jgi:hypothetical protein